ncbi:MAG TPA: hypothetical protein P5081_18460 [Phycisphaerae bacterium]|nr:hypothetical protein [Phycisphaerae bacterium]HRW54856.1 hypothetical protein [Phycisphaerae bacterium]
MSNPKQVNCHACGEKQTLSTEPGREFFCGACGASITPDAGDAPSSKPDIRKHLVITIPFIVLIVWFGWLWFVSGVLPSVQKYDNGAFKEKGLVKREGLATYRRTGHWETYHPNGVKASEGLYERGEKLAGKWMYWDAMGNAVGPPPGEEKSVASDWPEHAASTPSD